MIDLEDVEEIAPEMVELPVFRGLKDVALIKQDTNPIVLALAALEHPVVDRILREWGVTVTDDVTGETVFP